MKKCYETPNIEVVKFQYRDQVVVASTLTPYECKSYWLEKESSGEGCKFTGNTKGDEA